jgi:serine protease inhibitor
MMGANLVLAHKETTLGVSKANQDFTAKLNPFQVLSQGKDSNLVVSYFNISAIMAMTYAGAKGRTAGQMKTVLAFPKNDQALLEGYEELKSILKSCDSDRVTLDVAKEAF